MAPSLEIRVLGELEVLRDGKAVALPASKKTRALLGYLVLAGSRPQPRQRLCDLLWDGPSAPRAALRWSLTKLRPLVDEVGTTRLSADREHVAFVPGGARVDRTAVGDDLGAEASPSVDPSVRGPVDRGEVSVEVSVEVLRRAAAVFRGELLEGLDLPECYRFHEWCVAEREAARGVRASILATLVQRLAAVPEDALGYARARVAVDPLSEAGHIAVIELLVRLGRSREALKQYESCRRILEVQVGRGPSRALEVARFAIGKAPADAPSEPLASRAVVVPSVARAALVGRRAESAIIAEALRAATAREPRRVLLLSGEPGIGKTRLLAEVAEQAVARGGTAIVGRAFEAEMVRPYGAWIAALRSLPQGAIDGSLHAELAPLLPELGAARDETDRNRLFDAVSRLLQQRAASGPVVVALDDLQWFDEASVALLSSLSQSGAQSLAGSPVLFACAARSAEVDANPGVVALLRGLGRGGRLTRVELSPLDCEATAALVHSVDSHADASQIFADGGGNPLFSLELARAFGNRGELGDRGDADGGGAGHTLEGLIAERLARLDGRAAELLPWAAALGHAFSIDTLGALTSLAAPALLSAVEELERHGVLRATNAAEGCASYDFAHDLVRRTAYRALSEPRRRWVHLHVARTLHAANDDGGALAGDVAHHAALGGDSALAVSAYVAAGERGLRLFAYADANRLAGSGLPHSDRLPAGGGLRGGAGRCGPRPPRGPDPAGGGAGCRTPTVSRRRRASARGSRSCPFRSARTSGCGAPTSSRPSSRAWRWPPSNAACTPSRRARST